MTPEQFDAHLALHGLVRYTGGGMNLRGPRRLYVADEYLPSLFRLPGFVRIDQYGPQALAEALQETIPGFQEFGSDNVAIFYALKK